MTGVPERHEKLRIVARAALIVDLIGSVATGGYGLSLLHDRPDAGLGFLAGGATGVVLGLLLYCQFVLIHKIVNYAYRGYDALLDAAGVLRRQEEYTHTIAENSNLSEWAKRIVHREKDFEFLRDSIQGAIVRQDWEAAEHLIRDVDTVFGYHDAAARFLEQLEQARKATSEERVAAALARFDKLCDDEKWEQARRECERLKTLFVGDPRIASLADEIEARRQEHKHKLLADYDEAVRNADVDRAHGLLFALDKYLTPKEADAIKQSARGVFRARLEQLRTQFSLAVADQEFNKAIATGEELINEFPNSVYAGEISKMMPVLRTRAQQQQKAPHAAAVARTTPS
jgi:hypothetical protein